MLLLALLLVADPVPTIDGQIEAVKKERAVQAESRKREEAATAELKKLLDDLHKKIADLGLDGPPKPPPPPVNDPLLTALKAAFALDAGPQKSEAVKELAELYGQAAKMAADPAVKSTSELLTRVRQAMTVLPLLKGESLMGMRKLIASECQVLGEPSFDPMSEAVRTRAVELFGKIHVALKGVGP